MFYSEEEEAMRNQLDVIADNVDILDTTNETEEEMKKLNNKKLTGDDEITNEVLKCGGEKLNEEVNKLLNKITQEERIPDVGKQVFLFQHSKKREKRSPKIMAKSVYYEQCYLQGEQQEGRFCVHVIFIIRQLCKKTLDWNSVSLNLRVL